MKNYYYSSPIGCLKIQLKDDRLYSLSKISGKKQSNLNTPPLRKIKSQLDRYFSFGQPIQNIPLYKRGTPFQKKVWKCLQAIPYGKTYTYSEVAKKAGSQKAFRAVGTACAKNPWLLVVPCHRVVSTSGLGGFALGLKTKKWLLQKER